MSQNAPKLFVSYSWSSEDHENWVLSLCEALRANGVAVVLDKWDLKEGHDTVAFMEKMVTDEEVKKVALICDRLYAEKADGRSGGVGTETQIITGDIYHKAEQDKFVAVLAERDEHGKPHLPAYYKTRKYIDMSDEDLYGSNYEALLRWIYDEPFFVKPPIGKKPEFLKNANGPNLGTASRHRTTLAALRQGKQFSGGALIDYFETFSQNLEEFRIVDDGSEFDEQVVKNIELFLPPRNEAVEVFLGMAKYQPTEANWAALHSFFESLIPYLDRPNGEGPYHNWGCDNFRFVIQELFLYAVRNVSMTLRQLPS